MREAQMLEESKREQRATQEEELLAREALERLRQLKARFRAFGARKRLKAHANGCKKVVKCRGSSRDALAREARG